MNYRPSSKRRNSVSKHWPMQLVSLISIKPSFKRPITQINTKK